MQRKKGNFPRLQDNAGGTGLPFCIGSMDVCPQRPLYRQCLPPPEPHAGCIGVPPPPTPAFIKALTKWVDCV